MTWDPESERKMEKNITAVLGTCRKGLRGCGICCKQRIPGVAPPDKLGKQIWYPGEGSYTLGEGGCSVVYLEILRFPPAKPVLCAVKKLGNVGNSSGATPSQMLREIQVLAELQKRGVSLDFNEPLPF